MDVVLMSCFMVVTSHDMFDFCWQNILPFSVFPLAGLYPGPLFDLLYVDLVVFFWNFPPLVCFPPFKEKLGGFGVVLDGFVFTVLLYLFSNNVIWGDVPCAFIWRIF